MKTRVFADDGQPESWDFNDNFSDMDPEMAQELVRHWKRDSTRPHVQVYCVNPDQAASNRAHPLRALRAIFTRRKPLKRA